MRLFEVKNISAEQAKNMLLAYADSVAKVDFELMVPALARYFPDAVYTGTMYRAKDFDIDGPVPKLEQGKYQSWAKSSNGLDAAIADLYGDWADTLAIYAQDYEGIDVNAILGQHDHYNEEEIIAKVGNPKLNSLWYEGETWPPDVDMLRDEMNNE